MYKCITYLFEEYSSIGGRKMNDKEKRALFFDLYNAENENELEKIIINSSLLSDESNWKPYGGNRNNFGTFENQQNNPIPALVEKITNSIDACLLKKCAEENINPESDYAPKTMYEAVERFYSIKDGNMNDLTDKDRRSIAEDIQVIAIGGDKYQPNIVIYDNGEGQLPEDFENTLLSLHKGNKIKIPFAQGKYNMGSTGAVVFCGERKFQLIASKKANNKQAMFGFTLVRKHELSNAEMSQNFRSTWYEYFTIQDKIASFEIDSLDVGLNSRDFKTGTIVKLYSYQLPRGDRGNISTDLYRSFNQYFYNLPLPFLVYEKRNYGGNVDTKVIKGNRNRIDEGKSSNSNIDGTISLEMQTDLGASKEIFTIPINITVFKENPTSDPNRQYIGNKNLVFTLNGQVHGYEGQTFISKDLGFPLLKAVTLIAVDCNNMPVNVMQEVFMSNRTHLKQGKTTDTLREEIISYIKKDKFLKRINQERKDSLIGKSDNNNFNSIIELLPKNSEVFEFLKKDSHLPFSKIKKKSTRGSDKENSDSENKKLNRFPSQFKLNLKENKEGKIVKAVPINSSGHIDIQTDVQDDYLFRSSDAGELSIEILQRLYDGNKETKGKRRSESQPVQSIKVNRAGPRNGNIRLDINPTEQAKVGDEIEVNVNLTSPDGNFNCRFMVRIDKNIIPPKNAKEKESNNYPNPPVAKKAYKNPENDNDLAWSSQQLNWDGNDVVKVISGDNDGQLLVEAIVVNMDSFVLKEFINKNNYKNGKDIKRISDKYFKLIYTHSLGLYSICTKMQNNKEPNEDNVSDIQQVDDFISRLTKPYASFLLYMEAHNETLLNTMSDD